MHTGRCNPNVFFSNVNWGAGLSHMHNFKNGSLYCTCLFSNGNWGTGLSHMDNSENMGTASPREQCNSEVLKYGHTANLARALLGTARVRSASSTRTKIGGQASRTRVAVLKMCFFPMEIGGRASPTCTTPRTWEQLGLESNATQKR